MTRLLVAAFLIIHGLIHPGVYAAPKNGEKPAPFDPAHSWALSGLHVAASPMRVLGLTLAWVAALGFSVAGVALLADAQLWLPAAIVGALFGLLLKRLYFTPRLTVGALIDIGVLAAAYAQWPSLA